MNKIKILLVDDDEVDRELIRKSLKSLDAEVTEAATGAVCLELIKAQEFGLILLDHNLPDTTGLELITEIKKLTHAPVVIVTGFGNDDLVIATNEAGVIDYIPKNRITPEFLTRTVLHALLISKAQVEKEKREEEAAVHREVFEEIIKLAKERLEYYYNLDKIKSEKQ